MKKVKIGIFLFVMCSFAYLACCEPLFGIRYTVSPSLPYKVFISRPFKKLARDQYVSFLHPKSEVALAKQVVGLAGDHIAVVDASIRINGQDYGSIVAISKNGMPLSPIDDQEIPEGYVFVYAPHQESFDSRYQEFGLVAVDQLKESLWPLF